MNRKLNLTDHSDESLISLPIAAGPGNGFCDYFPFISYDESTETYFGVMQGPGYGVAYACTIPPEDVAELKLKLKELDYYEYASTDAVFKVIDKNYDEQYAEQLDILIDCGLV